MLRIGSIARAVIGAIALASPLCALAQDATPTASVSVEVDASAAPLTGLVDVKLEFTPYAEFDRAWIVRLELMAGKRRLIAVDHSPDPPTKRWRKEQVVRYTVACGFPFDPLIDPGAEIDVCVGFVDPANGEVHGPGESMSLPDMLPALATFPAPKLEPVAGVDRVAALVAAARERKAKGSPADAWSILELGIRAADEDSFKYALRDEVVGLGHFTPRSISTVEKGIVDGRIRDERERYLRLIAGRMYDQKKFHGALLLLDAIGGSLAEKADQAVLGALSDADRVQKDADGVKTALFDYVPDAEEAEVQGLIESLGPTTALEERAAAWRAKKRFGAARRAYRWIFRADDSDLIDRARKCVEEMEAECLAAVPQPERDEAKAAIDHPVWARTIAIPSHRFIFIGPKQLVETMPQDSLRRFDLAYVFLTDLFGRVPNPEGDRVTVYFKELWDFGGGVGGGKIIDIGNADYRAKGTRVDNGLLYHELTHCIDDTNPVFEGFREGLANFGAAYAYEALGQQEDSLHSFRGNLEAFEKEYLARDLEYWRIQNYGPSAGFFLSFLERHAKTKDGHDWRPYRQFFREYRDAPVRDGREPYIARSLAHYLMRAFGDAAFDDLVRYRFPLKPEDREVLGKELDAFDRGSGGSLDPFAGGGAFGQYPGSPLPRDVRARELLKLAEKGDFAATRRFGEEQLGIVYEWRVIGPFLAGGTDPLACVFPPETVIDFAAQYPIRNNMVIWAQSIDRKPVTLQPTGWVKIEYPYQDDTASYAYTTITSPAAMEAVAFVRADDDFALFVNGENLNSYRNRGENGSTPLQWRGPRREVADAMRLPLNLRAGPNVVLLKIKNRYGDAGFTLAFAKPDGSVIPGLLASAADAPGPLLPDWPDGVNGKGKPWKQVLAHNFKARAFGGKLDVTVGSFKSREGALIGESTGRGVEWRKYTVRPGFPKDSPSNLAWLSAEATKGVTDFRLEMEFAETAPPKLVVTFQGEGGNDGLSGWNLILEPWGESVRASLERYDRLVLQSPPMKAEGKHAETLVVERRGDALTVRLGDTKLFDRVPIDPIVPVGSTGDAASATVQRECIGFATWGATPRVKSIELSR